MFCTVLESGGYCRADSLPTHSKGKELVVDNCSFNDQNKVKVGINVKSHAYIWLIFGCWIAVGITTNVPSKIHTNFVRTDWK